MSAWQPIATAPKRGKHILVWVPNSDHPDGGYQTVAWWDGHFDTVFSERTGNSRPVGAWTDGTATCVGRLDAEYIALQPTHWMPLLPPPRADAPSHPILGKSSNPFQAASKIVGEIQE